jgi:hypothetical protein
LNEASDYGIVSKKILNVAGSDPLELFESLVYYGLCIDSLPHGRYSRHKEDKSPFVEEDFSMIVFKNYTLSTVSPEFHGVALAMHVDEFAVEVFKELMPNLHTKTRAGCQNQALNDVFEGWAKDWRLRMFIFMLRALENRRFIKETVSIGGF